MFDWMHLSGPVVARMMRYREGIWVYFDAAVGAGRTGQMRMVKFRCGHCGHRIAVQKRQLSRLIVCPDCQQATHPIAEQVIEKRAAATRAGASSSLLHTCANCSQSIGRLQTLHLWSNKVVCRECHGKLAAETPSPEPRALAAMPAPAARQPAVSTEALFDPSMYTRPFRGGLFGALVGLCVAGAALYGALSLLKDVAGLITGLAFGGLALLTIYVLVRLFVLPRQAPQSPRPRKRVRLIERQTPV